MTNVFDVILLVALPASGKSEVRNFMAQIDPERLKQDFHIGENLQLDDFPYVHLMRSIDNELESMNEPRIFYPGEVPLYDGRDWGTLIELLNEDYDDLFARRKAEYKNAADFLFERIDTAAEKVGIARRLALLSPGTRKELCARLTPLAEKMVQEKEEQYSGSFTDKTVIIECARGGKDGSSMPLEGTFGYQYSLPLLSDDILDHAAVLYIWVTPEESRRKNNARANPDDPGSNLFHGVPMAVMLGDYGCDDMQYLREHSEIPDTLTIQARGKTWHLPVGVFDNRVDKTSFLRKDKEEWTEEEISEMTEAVRQATDTMWAHYPVK